MKLQLISPIRTGLNESKLLMGVDFFIDRDTCYFLNPEKLFNELNKRGCEEDFANFLEKRPEEKQERRWRPNIRKALEKFGIPLKDVVSEYHSKVRPDVRGDLLPFSRNAFGEPFIPGTAIKGAIRTAVLWKLLFDLRDENPGNFEDGVVAEIERGMKESKNPRIVKKDLGQFLITHFLQGYGADDKTAEARTDLLRALEVSDSSPFDANTLKIHSVKWISLNRDARDWHFSTGGRTKEISQAVECAGGGPEPLEVEFKLRIDRLTVDHFRQRGKNVPPWFHCEENLLQVCQEYAAWCIEQEERPFFDKLNRVENIRDFYNIAKPNLRLGWGSGLGETTIISLLPKELRAQLKSLFIKGPKATVFPKTRRVVVDGNTPIVPLGWVRLTP